MKKEIKSKIITTEYSEEMKKSYIDYAINVITDRALPDVRDGFKPVHRRILWAMSELGLRHGLQYKKSARIVGEVMGKYHPHGDASIYDAMVHMAQNWCYIYPLVDGHGNFGSIEGDEQAASRYTEAKLSEIADELYLKDLEKGVVEFVKNFDDNEIEPTVLPVKIPNILLNGTEGIAVGMASKIPTHNFGEIVDALICVMDNPKVKDDDLCKIIKGPDFATGGIIANAKELPEIYKTGSGKIRVRGKATIENAGTNKKNIVITEIPYTMIGSIDKFMESVANLVHTKATQEIQDIKNFSGKEGIKIVIELKKDANAENVLNLIYKKAKLEDVYGYNAMVIVDGMPKQVSLKEILTIFSQFNRENYIKKYTYLLEKEMKQREIKEGLLKAIDCIDTIIEILRGAKKVTDAKECLMIGKIDNITFKTKTAERQAKKLHFTEIQTNAILEMRLQRLVGLELNTLEKEFKEHEKNIAEYSGLLKSDVKMKNRIKKDLLEIKTKYNKPRRTKITNENEIEIKKETFKEENITVLIDKFGYTKAIDEVTKERNEESLSEYKYCINMKNSDKICFFTDTGKCHFIKGIDIPVGKIKARGVMMNSLTHYSSDENILFVDTWENIKKKEFIFVNDEGMGKIVDGIEFEATKKSIDATKKSESKLVYVKTLQKESDIVLKTKNNMYIRFKLSEISKMKKTSIGVRCIKLKDDDIVVEVKTGVPRDKIGKIDFSSIKLTKRDGCGTKKS